MPNIDDSNERPTQPLPRYRPENQTGNRESSMPAGTSPTPNGAGGGEIPTVAEAAVPPETLRRPFPSAARSGADQVVTPQPLPIPRPEVQAEPRPRGAPAVLWAVAILALLLSLASLAMNGLLVSRAMIVRQKAVDGLDAAITGLDNLGGKGFQYNYHVKRTIPFSGDIPFKQELTFPFEGDIPINTRVQVPVDAGLLGTYQIEVPINTKVHIKTSVPIRIDETIHVSTDIPIDMTIPIDIKAGDPAIQQLLSPIREWLVGLRDSF